MHPQLQSPGAPAKANSPSSLLSSSSSIPIAEAIQLGAIDSEFFSRTFFPRTVRMPSPSFHKEVWDLLESDWRLVNIQVFRDGAKTSITRIYGAKRIAYGLARTIVWVGKSQDHAIRSVKWLKKQIEFNRTFAETFKLSKGSKWQDVEIEIKHGIEGHTVTVVAFGVTGSVRGVNIDDYRPDLIILDDILDEENTATEEQRKKMADLVYGALKDSLAPATEAPDAKMVMLQTPLNREDASVKALNDKEWLSRRFGIWTDDTADLPLIRQESRWPQRFPSHVVRDEKEAAIARNQLSLFLREKECRIVSPETASFRPEWLQLYNLAPDYMTTYMAIDPVPPPSEIQIAKGLKDKDFEAFAVIGRKGGDFYLLDYSLNRGHDPEWTVMEFFRLAFKWQPQKVLVESIAYQRTLAWLLRQAMQVRRQYFVIQEWPPAKRKGDTRPKLTKHTRIVDTLSRPASLGHFFVKEEHTDFITAFNEYPDVSHDDLLDAVSMAMLELSTMAGSGGEIGLKEMLAEEKDMGALTYQRGAP